MDTYTAGPLLELNKAVPSFEESGLPPRPMSLRLMAGDCFVVEERDPQRATMFADMCSGLVPLDAGQVSFMGLDWTEMKDRQLNALRGRIGRIARRPSWPGFVPMHLAIMLQQLHHTTRTQDGLLAEAARLAASFGLPGLPTQAPDRMSEADLCRAACVRAFLGRPHLLLLEDPLEGGPQELANPFLEALTEARDRGAGIIWLVRNAAVWQRYRSGVTATWRLADDGLAAVRMG